jgi:diguanylate cyclase (GGDEF)-like protein
LTSAPPQASTILASLGQAAFVWDIGTDAIVWSDHASSVFPDIPAAALQCGAEFSKLIEPERSIRMDALGHSPPAHGADGAPYRIEYGVRSSTSAPLLWIEETGCWFAGTDGRPARAQGIVRVNNERHARDEQLVRLSRHDPLTGELNRTHLIASLAEAIEEASRFRSSFAFMLIGIDRLARINDAFGFDVADAVISEVATRIRTRLRGGDMLGRFSGNKFGLILKNCTVDDMNIAAERFLAGIRDDQIRPGLRYGVDRRGQRAALRPQRRRGDQPRPGNPRHGEAPPRRIVFAVAPECRTRGPAPRQHPRHRRDRYRAQRAPDRDGVRAGGGSALAQCFVLRVPGTHGAG